MKFIINKSLLYIYADKIEVAMGIIKNPIWSKYFMYFNSIKIKLAINNYFIYTH